MTSLFRGYFLALCALIIVGSMTSCTEDSTGPVEKKYIVTGPATVNFGDVGMGRCKDTTIRYDNTTGKAVTLSSVTFAGAGFEWTGSTLPVEIAAGASIDLKVRFCPQSNDTVRATLVFKGTGGDSVSVKLLGFGVELKPLITGPAAIRFGDVTVGECKDTLIRYDNTTGAPVILENVVLTGSAASMFELTGGPLPRTIEAGGSIDLRVRYCPTALDSVAVLLTIAGTGGESVVIALSGKGIEAKVSGPTAGSSYTYNVYDTDAAGAKVPGTDATQVDVILETGITYEGKENVFVVSEGGLLSYYSLEDNGDISVYLDAAQSGPLGAVIAGWKRLPYGSKKTNVVLLEKDTTITLEGVPVPVTVKIKQVASYTGETTVTIGGKSYNVDNVTFTTSADLLAIVVPVGNITNVVEAGFIPAIGYQANFDSQINSTVQGFPSGGSRKKLKSFILK
jgi:hypothetical protein